MFTQLHCHSYYSFASGTIPADELPLVAASKGMSAVALTDINNLTGAIEFYLSAKKLGIKPIIGVDLVNGTEKAVLLAKNIHGYKEICDTVTTVLALNPQIKPKITYESISKEKAATTEVSVLKSIIPLLQSLSSNIIVLSSDPHILTALSSRPDTYIELIPSERKKWSLLRDIYRGYGLPVVASGNIFIAAKSDWKTHCILRAIGLNTNLGLLPPEEICAESQYFTSEAELQQQLGNVHSDAYKNASRIAEQCNVEFDFKHPKFAAFPCVDPSQLLKTIAEKGLWERYITPSVEHIQRFSFELQMINSLNATSYFLAVHDMIQYAKRKNYPFLTRGSGANSFIAYCMGISNVDPIENDLRFERFLNPERLVPPDFDVDFSWKDRYEIIHYMIDKYGRENSAMLCTIQTYRDKGSIREVGKALGFSEAEIDTFYPRLRAYFFANDKKHIDPALFDVSNQKLHDLSDWLWSSRLLLRFPRHLSVHSGGVILADKSMSHYCPTQMAPIGVPIMQQDMFSADDWKLIKLDILATRGLGTYWDTMKLVEQRTGKRPPVEDVTVALKDKRTRAIIATGKTKGCFYIESPAMMGLLKKLRVDTFKLLTAASSIIRPGVASSGMMQEFIARHHDRSRMALVNPELKKLLPDTYGVMVYQEDVLNVVHELAGLTYGQADMFRRAISGKLRSKESIATQQIAFIDGCIKNGFTPQMSEELWRQISSFSGYSFCKAHSASYAVLSFQEAWLKVHYPTEFLCSVLNNYGGFYSHQEYINEARALDIEVLLPDVNRSRYEHSVEQDHVIRLGFECLKEVSQRSKDNLLQNREIGGRYTSLEDFVNRSEVTPEDGRMLISIGACDCFGMKREQMQVLFASLVVGRSKGITQKRTKKQLVAVQTALSLDIHLPQYDLDHLTESSAYEDFRLEKQYCGYSVTHHPCDFLPSDGSVAPSSRLFEHVNKRVTVSGYIASTKHATTKKGDSMCMLNVADKQGMIDVVVWSQEFKKFYTVITSSEALRITGRIQESYGVLSLIATNVERLYFEDIKPGS